MPSVQPAWRLVEQTLLLILAYFGFGPLFFRDPNGRSLEL